LSPDAALFALTQTLSAWLLALALLGLAMRLLTFTSTAQRYLTAAAFPVYVLHMPLLTVIAYYMLKVPLPWPLQLLLITLATALAAFGIYELVVRRTPLTRLLFGVKAPHPMEGSKGGLP
jgi:peptidoglycan/LPS O-acetylase OafA/YrhL